MRHIKRLLVVVDPTVDADFVVNRARGAAKASGAAVRFFINSANTLTQKSYAYEGIDKEFFERQRRLFAEHYQHQLDKLAGDFAQDGIKSDFVFREENNLADAIIHQAVEYKADLLLKSTHQHNLLRRTVVTNTDWRLIRKCPCALQLVKPRAWQNDGSVVAAVDPLHVKAAQSRLDHRLIEVAEMVAKEFDQTPRVFHCYYPYPTTVVPALAIGAAQMIEIRKLHQEKMDDLMQSHHIPPENVEIVSGDLVPALVHCLEKVNANILVIGALSRNFIERAIVGNTAEKILDDCPCDVLVIKA